MADNKLFYIDPKTGEYKEDKRNSAQKIEYTLAKINLTIDTMEKAVEARLGMFEALLRERLNSTCSDVDDLIEENKSIESRIKKIFTDGAQQLLERQLNIDKKQDERLLMIERKIKDHSERIEKLEDKPVLNKAKVFDKVVVALGSLIAGYIAANIGRIITFLSGV